MKKLLLALKHEHKLPIVGVVLAIVTSTLNLVFGGMLIYHTSTGTFEYTAGKGVYIGLLAVYLILFIALLVALVKAFKFDKVKEKEHKDERELLHEYIIAYRGYNVLIFGIVIYLIWADSFVLPLLLALVLYVRLKTRVRLESEG